MYVHKCMITKTCPNIYYASLIPTLKREVLWTRTLVGQVFGIKKFDINVGVLNPIENSVEFFNKKKN